MGPIPGAMELIPFREREKRMEKETCMECVEICHKENAWLSESLVRISRWFFFGAFLSGITVLFFLLWNSPNFPHTQNFLERYIEKNYHWAILSEMVIVLLSGAYTLFSTIRSRSGWIGGFVLTPFFLGLSISLIITKPWFYNITQENSRMDKAIFFAFLAIFLDGFLMIQAAEDEENFDKETAFTGIFSFLILLFLLLMVAMSHDVHRAEAYLQQSCKEAKAFPKSLSYSMIWSNVRPSEVRSDLQNLGGYGAMIAAKAYQRAGYEMPVVVWDNLMRLGQYVNVLQSRGLLSGGVPWQITPKAGTLRHLRRLEPYYRFFRHPNTRFYLDHSGLNFFWRYRRIQALHRGDFFTRKLASIAEVEAVGRWLEPQYDYEISLMLGTGGVSGYYASYHRRYEKWQRCLESEGPSFCSDLKPSRGYIPNN